MNKTKHFAGRFGIAACSALLGCATSFGQPSASMEISLPLPSVEVTLPSVEIRAESDFYEPLAPEGEWVVVGSYGRCWRPSHVERDWRPYCNGSWERTEAGWYWVSDEPWAWATYHYGRWDYTDRYGWYWVPQVQWAPAWVSWHEGGGYVGWAPLQPSVSISINGLVGYNQSRISPRAFIFVRQGQFLDPIRPAMVIANNTTVINHTKTVINTRIVNNTVINEGPATAVIEKASGRTVHAVAVQQLRHQAEAPIAARQRRSTAITETKSQRAVAGQVVPENKTVAAHEPAVTRKSDAVTRESAAVGQKNREALVDRQSPVPAAAPELKPGMKHDPAHAVTISEPTGHNFDRQPSKQEKPAQSEDQNAQQSAKHKSGIGEKNIVDQANKNHESKP
jgi:hypothetical protein